MQYQYQPKGVCSQRILFELDGDVVKNIRFIGGCSGNTQGVAALAEGLTVDEIEQKLGGIRCGFKSTSCPDQLAKAVRAAKAQED
ncbi:MAG: TIGR03905 family TSCPD domain-containing protein [Clostridia bacterium]|nr:TIGR03905 family TSCPD domain-containing protein [Clostridia bacterium]MBR3552171.1 TIGR03905 family TSCPD domain-containing protein [Clostridia bacterium]